MSWLNRIFDRIDVSALVSQHLTTFYFYEKKKFYNVSKIPLSDKVLFLVLPVLFSSFLCWAGLRFNQDYVNIVLTCLSIFSGLLFGLLTLVFGLIQDNQKALKEGVAPEEKRKMIAKFDLTNHLFINIGFSITLSILALVFVLGTQFYPSKLIAIINNWEYYPALKMSYLFLVNGISFFLIIEFILTLLMIIRRFTVLFLNQIAK